jgi:hypothetical protein
LQRAVELSPYSEDTLLARAYFNLSTGDLQAAKADLQKYGAFDLI